MTAPELILILIMLALWLVPGWVWWDMQREKRASDREGRELQAALQEMLDSDSIAGVEAWWRKYNR